MSEVSSCKKINSIYKSLGIIIGVGGLGLSFLNFAINLAEYNAALKQLGRYAKNSIDVYRSDLIFSAFMLALFSVVLILFLLLKKITCLKDFALAVLGLLGIYCFSIIISSLLTVIHVNMTDNQNLNIFHTYGLAYCFIIIPLMFFSFVLYYHSNRCILFLIKYVKESLPSHASLKSSF